MTVVEWKGFNPFDPAALQNPHPYYAALRSEAPVFYVESLGFYLVMRHDLVNAALRDTKRFSSRFGRSTMPLSPEDEAKIQAVFAEGYQRVPTMLSADAPDHTRFRRLLSHAFNARSIAAMEPFIREIVGRLIDDWGQRTDIEFVRDFAVPLPVRVIATMLSVPEERWGDVKRWSDAATAGIGTALSLDARIAAERTVNEYQHYFAGELERRRQQPQDDLLTKLVHARIDGADDANEGVDTRPLDMTEMLSMLSQLMVAGNETTTKLLAEMIRLLGEHPDLWGALQADPSLIERTVEESLRLSSPTQGIFRIATEDMHFGGVDIPAGARLVMVYAAANRDENVFSDADSFDPDRERLKEHLAFGKGIHFCIGAPLSRLEVRIALEALTRRVPRFGLAASNDYAYFPSFMLRGLQRLDIELDVAALPRTESR
jgi:cytochrome P450